MVHSLPYVVQFPFHYHQRQLALLGQSIGICAAEIPGDHVSSQFMIYDPKPTKTIVLNLYKY